MTFVSRAEFVESAAGPFGSSFSLRVATGASTWIVGLAAEAQTEDSR